MAELDSGEVNTDLIKRFRSGDIAAVEEIYHLYFDRIYSMVFNHVGRNHKNAEEVVQESWLAIVKSSKKFKGDSQLYTWIYKIVWYKIKDFQRDHYRDLANLQQPTTLSAIPALQVIDSEPLPDEVVESEETRELVRKALDSIPDHYQQVLTLKYIENMSARDIGDVMGKSSKSVDSLLDRARLALRTQIIKMNG